MQVLSKFLIKYCYVISFLCANYLFAQNIEIVIMDKTRNIPLEGVHVYSKKTTLGTTTDINGRFSINFNNTISQSDTIYFSYLGFRTIEINFGVLKKMDTLFLKEKFELIDNIKVTSNRKLNSKINYKNMKPLKQRLHSFGSVIVENKIFVFGGDISYRTDGILKSMENDPTIADFNYTGDREGLKKFIFSINSLSNSFKGYNKRIYVYDISSDSWKVLKQKTQPRAYHSAIYDKKTKKIFILGGKSLSIDGRIEYLNNEIEVFDLKPRIYQIDKINPHSTVNPISIPVDGGFIVLGGSVKMNKRNVKEYFERIHLYDTESGLWYNIGELPSGKETTGTTVNGRIYLFGGQRNKKLTTIESFDLKTGMWKNEGQLFEPLDEISVTSNGNMIYLYHFGKLLTYNVELKMLKEYFVSIYTRDPAMHIYNNKLYIIGGYGYDTNEIVPLSSVYSIDIREFEKTKVQKSKSL